MTHTICATLPRLDLVPEVVGDRLPLRVHLVALLQVGHYRLHPDHSYSFQVSMARRTSISGREDEEKKNTPSKTI